MKNFLAVCAIAIVCACSGCGTSTTSSVGGSGEGASTEHPLVCDAPMCDADEGLYGLSVSLPPVEMEGIDPAALRVDLERRIAERTPELILVAHCLTGTLTGDSRLDAALKAHPQPPEGRRRLVTVLDRDFAGWRDLADVPWTASVAEVGDVPFESVWQGLETSGCGEMRLQMALGGVTVHERDDNFSGDRVYCIVRARASAVR